MEPHWGPRIEKIPIRGGIGAIIAIGLMIDFLADVPETRLWLYISVPLGLIFGIILYLRHIDLPDVPSFQDSLSRVMPTQDFRPGLYRHAPPGLARGGRDARLTAGRRPALQSLTCLSNSLPKFALVGSLKKIRPHNPATLA
ncbi:MAG TPA: hypothetical protein VET69_07045 [Terriglobales bacterium]|nr:hypothetical protein [Terriglobales bacterium]